MIVFFSIKYRNYTSHLNEIRNFFKTIETIKQKRITDNDISTLKTTFFKPYQYLSKQLIKNAEIQKFIYTYTNLLTLKEQWNNQLLEKEKVINELSSKTTLANEFMENIKLYKKAYFTSTMKNALLKNYKETYDFFNLRIIKELNLQVPIEFLKTYSTLDKLTISWNFEYVKNELTKYEVFFNNIDNKSLDYQQRTAVVTDFFVFQNYRG